MINLLKKIIGKHKQVQGGSVELEHLKTTLNLCKITETFPQDIFIAGYPKSGNTWMQNLVSGIIYGIDTTLLPDKLTQQLVPDVHFASYYTRYLDFNCFKTHDFPKPEHRRVIHLVRDGRDAMASYYAMKKSEKQKPDWGKMIKQGEGLFPGKWNEHTKRWIDNPFKAEILVIRYENLHQDPLREMTRFVEFTGLQRSPELIQRSVSGNTFENMQKKEKIFGWNTKLWNTDEKFIRRGQIGSYKDEIPEEFVHYFEEESKNELKHFGYL